MVSWILSPSVTRPPGLLTWMMMIWPGPYLSASLPIASSSSWRAPMPTVPSHGMTKIMRLPSGAVSVAAVPPAAPAPDVVLVRVAGAVVSDLPSDLPSEDLPSDLPGVAGAAPAAAPIDSSLRMSRQKSSFSVGFLPAAAASPSSLTRMVASEASILVISPVTVASLPLASMKVTRTLAPTSPFHTAPSLILTSAASAPPAMGNASAAPRQSVASLREERTSRARSDMYDSRMQTDFTSGSAGRAIDAAGRG